jgi:hypothetical protein
MKKSSEANEQKMKVQSNTFTVKIGANTASISTLQAQQKNLEKAVNDIQLFINAYVDHKLW